MLQSWSEKNIKKKEIVTINEMRICVERIQLSL